MGHFFMFYCIFNNKGKCPMSKKANFYEKGIKITLLATLWLCSKTSIQQTKEFYTLDFYPHKSSLKTKNPTVVRPVGIHRKKNLLFPLPIWVGSLFRSYWSVPLLSKIFIWGIFSPMMGYFFSFRGVGNHAKSILAFYFFRNLYHIDSMELRGHAYKSCMKWIYRDFAAFSRQEPFACAAPSSPLLILPATITVRTN